MFANCFITKSLYCSFAIVWVNELIESLNALRDVSIIKCWDCDNPTMMPDRMLSWVCGENTKSDFYFILEQINPKVRIDAYFTI